MQNGLNKSEKAAEFERRGRGSCVDCLSSLNCTFKSKMSIEGVRNEFFSSKCIRDVLDRMHMLEVCFDHTFNPIAILDRDFNYMKVNQAFSEAGRLAVSELAGKNHFELFPKSEMRDIFERVRDWCLPYRGYAMPMNFSHDPEWGTTYWDWALVPINGTKGKVEWLVLSLENVTQNIRAQDDIAALSEFRETVIDTADVWLSVTNAEGKVVIWNRAAEKISGFSRDSIIGKDFPWEQLYPEEEYRGHVRQRFEKVIATAEPIEDFETEIRLDRGDQRTISWNCRRLLPGKNTRAILSLGRDVTSEKIASEQIELYQKQLRSISSEACLAEQAIRRKVATELHDGVGQLLAISKLKLNLMRQGCESTELKELVNEVLDHLNTAIRYTRSLTCELSPPVLHELGLEAGIEWLCEHVQKQHKIVCRYEKPQVPMTIQADTAILLFEMVRELVFNIIKHSQAANAWVTLAKSGEYVQITVSDDGVGFEPDKMEAETESFGLFSVRERLKHLNGSMEIKTKTGGGTRISIWAPV